ncbi:MAG: o-succinylbenzoate--CoA ligase [Chloroflexota bacterium]
MIDWLSQQARSNPDKIALIFEHQVWSYTVLNQDAEKMARNLLASGIKPGQHIAVLASSSPDYLVLIHALIKLGAVLIPLNTRLTFEELSPLIELADVDYLIYSPAYYAVAAKLTQQKFSFTQITSSDRNPDQELPTAFAFENLQAIIYTSGTTGLPKGAMLTVANHFWSATASAYRLGLSTDDRWLLCLPLYHVGGLAIVLRSCLYGTAVILHDDFSPQEIAISIEYHAATMISLVPTMLNRFMGTGSAMLAKLRLILLGGGAASPQLIQESLAAGLPIISTYGLTEAASQVATSTLENVAQKFGSAGKPLNFTQVQIETSDGEVLPAGEIGEIVVSGPTVMGGYYQNSEATEAVLDDDRLRTGDIGYLDSDGDLWVLQRRSDLIISGGENIYPSEVESVLMRHPAIKEACVIGLEHPEWGQQVAAAIVFYQGKTISTESIQQHCRKSLAGYKIPRIIQFLDHFPRTASGKIVRNRLIQDFEQIFEDI